MPLTWPKKTAAAPGPTLPSAELLQGPWHHWLPCSGTHLPQIPPGPLHKGPLCLQFSSPTWTLPMGMVTYACHTTPGRLSKKMMLHSKTLSHKRNTQKQRLIPFWLCLPYPMCSSVRAAHISLPNPLPTSFTREHLLATFLTPEEDTSNGSAHYNYTAWHQVLNTAGICMFPHRCRRCLS